MRFDHVGIKTADLEKSLDFYTKTLGFTILEVKEFEKKYYFVGNEHTTIEIEAANPGDQQISVDVSSGINHLAFIVDDIEALVKNIKTRGGTVIMDPLQLRPDRKVAFIQDPDGVRIQLIQPTE
jgi:lactoylglutathione lyase